MSSPDPVYNQIQLRRGTAAGWVAANPILSAGEPGVETDTGRVKIGDGHLPWQDLKHTGGGGASAGLAALLPEISDVVPDPTPPAWPAVGAFTASAPAGTTVEIAAAPVSRFGIVADNAGVNIVNDPHGAHPSPALEFDVTAGPAAAVVAPVVTNPAAVTVDARLAINGQPYGRAGGLAIAASGTAYLPLTIPAGTTHRIRVELENAYLTGLRYTLGSCAIAPTVDRGPKIAVLGDSWTEGALGVPELSLWANVLGRMLGAPAVARMGQGGSGYVATVAGWNAMPYGHAIRLGRLTSYAPDLLVVQGSQNDDNAGGPAIAAAAASFYAAVAGQLPTTKVVAIGPPRLGGAPSAARLANRDAVKAAALAAPSVVGFVDQIGANPPATSWITGTGRTGSPAGDGNADVVLGSDGAHMTIAGHAHFARRAYTEIVRLLRDAA